MTRVALFPLELRFSDDPEKVVALIVSLYPTDAKASAVTTAEIAGPHTLVYDPVFATDNGRCFNVYADFVHEADAIKFALLREHPEPKMWFNVPKYD